METCGTCKHWRKIRDEDYTVEPSMNSIDEESMVWPGPHGECGLFETFTQDVGAWITTHLYPSNVYDESGSPRPMPERISGDASLITRPDFGCILHKA